MKIITGFISLLSLLLCLLSFGRFPRGCKNDPPSTTETEETTSFVDPYTFSDDTPESVRFNAELLRDELSIYLEGAAYTARRLYDVGIKEIVEMSVTVGSYGSFTIEIVDADNVRYKAHLSKYGYVDHILDANGITIWVIY